MTSTDHPIPIFENVTASQFREEVQPRRQPSLLRGLDVGPCVEKWRNLEHLLNNIEDKPVKVHVSTEPLRMDFRTKNFKYCVMNFHTLLRRASLGNQDSGNYFISNEEKYYLRHVGDDPRPKDAANFERDFPGLRDDFKFPANFFDSDSLFSSVFRVSSDGIRVWTHYDVLDNFYVQVVGRKRAVMWAPNEALNLYLDGDKSKVIDIDAPDVETFPKFVASERYVVDVEPGDVLFIPALWFHNMTADGFGLAVNLFWKNLDQELYDQKDPYGNKDLLPAAKSLRMLDNVIKQLEDLPSEYRDFYARQLIARIESKCLSKPL